MAKEEYLGKSGYDKGKKIGFIIGTVFKLLLALIFFLIWNVL